jgi:hypothetical protein
VLGTIFFELRVAVDSSVGPLPFFPDGVAAGSRCGVGYGARDNPVRKAANSARFSGPRAKRSLRRMSL